MEIQNLVYLILALIFSGGAIFLFFRKKDPIKTLIQDTMDSNIQKVDSQVSSAPIEKGETKPIEGTIKVLSGQAQEVKDKIEKKEEEINKVKTSSSSSKPLENPQEGADWINSVLNKK